MAARYRWIPALHASSTGWRGQVERPQCRLPRRTAMDQVLTWVLICHHTVMITVVQALGGSPMALVLPRLPPLLRAVVPHYSTAGVPG